MTAVADRINALIAADISARREQVAATVELIDGGATIPFIARYRKEATGGLDDIQLRKLEERLTYLRELEARRDTIVASISAQGKLTDDLAAKLAAATTKAEVEDLYLPYKPKRRTKAEIARERGLQPLADRLMADRRLDPAMEAAKFVTAEVADAKVALDGARDILAETFAENAGLIGRLRQHMTTRATLRARVVEGKQAAG
ncbi:MAG: Tex-like N-terminal domain-containing protein, partial [Ancalomicrobiaceae bacterium]|nr:Tex-like N-terminal domain-containing protein [Ancalomicrobiaceae bacterium]